MNPNWLTGLKVGDEVAIEVTDSLMDEIPRYQISTVTHVNGAFICAGGYSFVPGTGIGPSGVAIEPVTDTVRANVRRHWLPHLVRTSAHPSRLVNYDDRTVGKILDLMGISHQ